MTDQRGLNADLHIISSSDLQITPLGGSFSIIRELDDEPNDVGGLTAYELKSKFDEAGVIIQNYINGTLIPEVLGAEGTEAAREANEEARQANEAARQAAETGRAGAETVRDSAESARVTAEASRAGQEDERISAEHSRNVDESSRIYHENIRQRNEDARQRAEQRRDSAENTRNDLESSRASNESARMFAEEQRAQAETWREQAEADRERNETEREAAEMERHIAQTDFFGHFTAGAVTLEPGEQATAQAVPEDGSFRLTIGVPQGIQGPKGDTGAGLEVLGIYATLAELQAAHPTGSSGAAYAVGTAEDNAVYVWSADAGGWASVGPLRGQDGKQGARGEDYLLFLPDVFFGLGSYRIGDSAYVPASYFSRKPAVGDRFVGYGASFEGEENLFAAGAVTNVVSDNILARFDFLSRPYSDPRVSATEDGDVSLSVVSGDPILLVSEFSRGGNTYYKPVTFENGVLQLNMSTDEYEMEYPLNIGDVYFHSGKPIYTEMNLYNKQTGARGKLLFVPNERQNGWNVWAENSLAAGEYFAGV